MAGGWCLYPQVATLGPAEAQALAKAPASELATEGAKQREQLLDGEHWNARHVAFAPTGGRRITPNEAERLRTSLLGLTEGFRGLGRTDLGDDEKRAFDANLSAWLGEHLKIAPSEAAQGAVWAWLGCAVAPELVRWRWPGETIDHRRFSGSRVRNLFASRWWRWRLLWDAEHTASPAWLLVQLGEDELVQLTERTTIATNGPLVRSFAGAFVRAVAEDASLSRMHVLREATKRLLRLNGLLALDALEPAELTAMAEGVLGETLAAMGSRARRARRVAPPSPAAADAPRMSWPELAEPGVIQIGAADLPRDHTAASDKVSSNTATEPAHFEPATDPILPAWPDLETEAADAEPAPQVGPDLNNLAGVTKTAPQAPATVESPAPATPGTRYRLPEGTPPSLAERLLAGGALGNQAVRELTGWTDIEAREWLIIGVAEGWLLKTGEKRGTRYQFIGAAGRMATVETDPLETALDRWLDDADLEHPDGLDLDDRQRALIALGLRSGVNRVSEMAAADRRAVRNAFAANASYEAILEAARAALQPA